MTKTIEQKALKFIDDNNLIQKGDKILVALSGGADSVFLLSLLLKFQNRSKIKVVAFHLNHQLRGKSADEDESFCNEFCKMNNVELIRVSKNVKSYAKKFRLSVEEAGREIRYQELNNALTKTSSNKIATAHNASDNVETVLLNFFKGTGIKGLAGIPVKRENIIRPILCLTSEEIRSYLKKNKIPFRVDESNLNSDYERNFLRNEIIPQLKKKLNPRLEEKINNTSKIIYEISSFVEDQIDGLIDKAVKKYDNELHFNVAVIQKFNKSFLSFFLKLLAENQFKIEMSSENIFSLINLLKMQTGKEIHLKQNIVAAKERNELVIRKIEKNVGSKSIYKIKVGQKLMIDGKVISISEINRKMTKFSTDKTIEFISADDLKNEFEIRKWKAGDKFQPIGMKGTKKISDFLSDVKSSSIAKKEHLILTNGKKIVWVIGLRIDDRFKVSKETKKILKLSVTKK